MAKKKKKAKELKASGSEHDVFSFEDKEYAVQVVMSLARAFVCNDLSNEFQLALELSPEKQVAWLKELAERLSLAAEGPPNQFMALMSAVGEVIPYEKADGFCRALWHSYASMPVLVPVPEPEGPEN